nr:death-inducer obliterator 1-like [Ipomoea batatas]
MKMWPNSLEVKGRVRIDAFEKFIEELPMSRSRAVMVTQFVLQDKSSEDERNSLSKAVESYVSDNSLGFAQLAESGELMAWSLHVLCFDERPCNYTGLKDACSSTEKVDGTVVERGVVPPLATSSDSHHTFQHLVQATTQPQPHPPPATSSPSSDQNSYNLSGVSSMSKARRRRWWHQGKKNFGRRKKPTPADGLMERRKMTDDWSTASSPEGWEGAATVHQEAQPLRPPSSPLAVPLASSSASGVALIKEKSSDDATAGNPASSSPLCNAKDNRRSTLFVTPQSSTDRD